MVLVNPFCVLLKRPIFLLKSPVLRAGVPEWLLNLKIDFTSENKNKLQGFLPSKRSLGKLQGWLPDKAKVTFLPCRRSRWSEGSADDASQVVQRYNDILWTMTASLQYASSLLMAKGHDTLTTPRIFWGYFLPCKLMLFSEVIFLRKIPVSVKFVSAILGPEMAAPILWTPGKMRSFCRKNHVRKIPPFKGGGFGGGGSADFIFMGARIFLIFKTPREVPSTRRTKITSRG